MQITEHLRTDPVDRLESMLRRSDEVARKKLMQKDAQTAPQVTGGPLPPQAADEADQAYGAAMSLLAEDNGSGMTHHMLDAERVAALLDL